MSFFDKFMNGVGIINELGAKRIDSMSDDELNKIGAEKGHTASYYRKIAAQAHQHTRERESKK